MAERVGVPMGPAVAGPAFPVDLAVALAWVAVGLVAVPASDAWTRWLLVVPAFGFFLGYLAVGALFPGRSASRPGVAFGLAPRGALALGLSVFLVVLPALVLGLLGEFRLETLRIALVVVAAPLATVAIGRWYDLPPDLRWTPLPRTAAAAGRSGGQGKRGLRAADVAVTLAAALAIAGVAFLAVRPPPQEHFTELYLLGAAGGADCYPDLYRNGTYLTSSRSCPAAVENVTVGIRNLEGGRRTYVLEVRWQDDRGIDEPVVRQTVTLDPVDPAVGSLHEAQFEQVVPLDGAPPAQTARLQVLLFLDGRTVPIRSLHLWVETVS